jgi:multidrug transporter EmrE-like cation transporter
MGLKDTLLCSTVALALPAGQALFKWAALYDGRLQGSFIARALQNWPLMAAFGWYGLTALLWFFVLTRVPLSQAYVFSLVGSGLVPLIAWVVFKEPLSWTLLIGYALMVAGLAVIMGQTQP